MYAVRYLSTFNLITSKLLSLNPSFYLFAVYEHYFSSLFFALSLSLSARENVESINLIYEPTREYSVNTRWWRGEGGIFYVTCKKYVGKIILSAFW